MILLAVALTCSLSGCADDRGIAEPGGPREDPVTVEEDKVLPTATTEDLRADYPAAEISGLLEAHTSSGRAYFVLRATDHLYGLVFPPGYGAASGPDGLHLLDTEGKQAGKAGASGSFGGGECPDCEEFWRGGPQVDSFWLVSPW